MGKIRLIFDRRKQASLIKEGCVEVVIAFSRTSRKYVNTSVKCYPKEWKNGKFIGVRAEKLHVEVMKVAGRCEKALAAMMLDDAPMELDVFNSYYEKIGLISKEKTADEFDENSSFLDFMEEEIMNSTTMRDSTKRQHLVALGTLREFGRIVRFRDLTLQNIMLFDRFIRRNGKSKSQPTIHNYHKNVKKYVRIAYKFGIIKSDPYIGFEDKRGRCKERHALDMEELELIQNAKLSQRYAKVRDVFVFQAYTGLAYSDLHVYKPYITEERDGITYIKGERAKTGVQFFTPMLPPAKVIYEKYSHRLPVISLEQYNSSLHHIEKVLGLTKSLTSHVARHTFATAVTLANNVPIEVVSKMLGHTNIRTTQIYAKVMDAQIEKAVAVSLKDKF